MIEELGGQWTIGMIFCEFRISHVSVLLCVLLPQSRDRDGAFSSSQRVAQDRRSHILIVLYLVPFLRLRTNVETGEANQFSH